MAQMLAAFIDLYSKEIAANRIRKELITPQYNKNLKSLSQSLTSLN